MTKLTDKQIEDFRTAADNAGDHATVAACCVALGEEPLAHDPTLAEFADIDKPLAYWLAPDRTVEEAKRVIENDIAEIERLENADDDLW